MFVWMFLFYFTRVFGYNNFASFSYLLALINYSFKSISSLSNDKYLRFYNSNLFNVSFIYFFIGWAMLSALNYFRDESILIDYILDSHNKIIFLYRSTETMIKYTRRMNKKKKIKSTDYTADPGEKKIQ